MMGSPTSWGNKNDRTRIKLWAVSGPQQRVAEVSSQYLLFQPGELFVGFSTMEGRWCKVSDSVSEAARLQAGPKKEGDDNHLWE